jgi:uncharacterized protein YkwD
MARWIPALCVALVVGTVAAVAAPQRAAAGSRVPAVACPHADDLGAPPAVARQTMVCLVNAARRARGLEPLVPSQSLERAATLKLGAVIRCDAFSHTPCGDPFEDVFRKAGYTRPGAAWTIGENLALGTETLSSPQAILSAWLNSPAHRRTMFTPGFRELGVGIARRDRFLGQSGAVLWATAFGVRS